MFRTKVSAERLIDKNDSIGNFPIILNLGLILKVFNHTFIKNA